MESYHVIDIRIDRQYVRQMMYLPVWIRHITGVLFFPVIPYTGYPDGEPLGMAGLSLQNEQLNTVTDMRVYSKSPTYYKITGDYPDAGRIFLDRGYGAYDIFKCNEAVLPNSLAIFKYANRKMIQNADDRFNADFSRLRTLIGKKVFYWKEIFTVMDVRRKIDDSAVIIVRNFYNPALDIEIKREELSLKILTFSDASNPNLPPFFQNTNSTSDQPFVMKLILRYENQPENQSSKS